MSNVFTPLSLTPNFKLKNRLVLAPMTTWSSHEDGRVSDEELAYYTARSGGVGMVITATAYTQAHGKGSRGQFYAGDDSMLTSLKTLATSIKSAGARAILQVYHAGRKAEKEVMPDGVTRSASSIQGLREVDNIPQAMTENEIKATIESFYQVTHRAFKAGFDGLEIHGANTYLIQQFYSPHANQREDYWGGSRRGRLNMPLEIVDACLRAKVEIGEPGFIVGYRLSPEENHTPGITLEDTQVLIDRLCGTTLDYLHISLKDFRQGSIREGANHGATLNALVDYIDGRKSIIGVGSVRTLDDANEALSTGVDLVAIGRQMLIDSKSVEKWARGHTAYKVYDPKKREEEAMTKQLEDFILNCNGWVPVKV